MKRYIFSILATLVAVSAVAWPPAKEAPFRDNEQLVYDVSYKAALWPNTVVAEVVMKVNSGDVAGTPAYHVWANARVLSFYKIFYDLSDTYEVWLDRNSLIPLKFANDLKEGKYRFKSTYLYDWEQMKVTTTSRNPKWDEDRHFEHELTRESMDPLSMFMNLRCEDLETFAIGEDRVLQLVFSKKIRYINYRLLSRETRSVKGIGTFKTLKFSCQLANEDGDSFEDGSEFYIWITDDENKVPIYLESPIRVGSVRATLTKLNNLKYPLESKIK